MIFGTCNPEKILHQQLIDLSTLSVSCSHCTLGNPPQNHFSTLFIHDSDYLQYLRIKCTATVTVQLNHTCLLNVTWTVLSRRVADARAAASDPQHSWGRVCHPSKQCTSTVHSSQSPALWNTWIHQSWHDMWPSNSRDLNPADYCIWGMMQKRVHQVPICNIMHELWQQIVETWAKRGGRCKWSVVKETGIVYPCNRWSLWTLAVTLLPWHSICHSTQLALFTATSASQHNSPFHSHQRLEGNNVPSIIRMSSAISQGSVVTFFMCDWQVHNHGYSLFYSEVM